MVRADTLCVAGKEATNLDKPFDDNASGGDNILMNDDRLITDTERVPPTLATKADLGMRAESKDSRSDIKDGFHELLVEFQKMRADVANTKIKVEQSIQAWSRWNLAALIAMFGVIGISAVGLIYTIWNTNNQLLAREQTAVAAPAQTTPPAPPVIINIPPPQTPYPPAQAAAPASN